MEHVVIVSHLDKNTEIIRPLLRSLHCKQISVAKTCGEARMMSFDYDVDLFIIYSPVDTKSGEDLAIELTSNGISQVIMIVKNENYEYLSNRVETSGVLVVPSPIDTTMLYITLKFAKASHLRLQAMQKTNLKLTKKMEDMKIIDRAKCLLITERNMSEKDAHKYIEKEAMDSRVSKRAVADSILRQY